MEVSTAFLSIALTPHVFVGAACQSDVDQTPAHVFSKFMLILTTQCLFIFSSQVREDDLNQ